MSSAPETSPGEYVDEGYKALAARNLFLFGVDKWHPADCVFRMVKGESLDTVALLCAPGLIQSLLPIGDFLPRIRNLAVIACKEGHVLRKRRSYAATNCCAEWSHVKLQRKWSRKRRLSGLSQALFNASRIVLVSYGSTYSACSAK